jgi:Ca-activated chloride channel family protein
MKAQFTLSLALTIAAIFAPWRAAQDARPERKIEIKPVFTAPGEARAGALLLKSNDQDAHADAGRFVEAPRLGTDIDLVVSGPTIRARVTQMFHNPTDGWVEAIYVYPLPDASASTP